MRVCSDPVDGPAQAVSAGNSAGEELPQVVLRSRSSALSSGSFGTVGNSAAASRARSAREVAMATQGQPHCVKASWRPPAPWRVAPAGPLGLGVANLRKDAIGFIELGPGRRPTHLVSRCSPRDCRAETGSCRQPLGRLLAGPASSRGGIQPRSPWQIASCLRARWVVRSLRCASYVGSHGLEPALAAGLASHAWAVGEGPHVHGRTGANLGVLCGSRVVDANCRRGFARGLGSGAGWQGEWSSPRRGFPWHVSSGCPAAARVPIGLSVHARRRVAPPPTPA